MVAPGAPGRGGGLNHGLFFRWRGAGLVVTDDNATHRATVQAESVSGRHRRAAWLMMGLVGVAALTLRATLYHQPTNSDDVSYYWSAAGPGAEYGLFADPNVPRRPATGHSNLRLGILLPIRGLSRLIPYSQFGFYATVYLFAALCLVAVGVFGYVVGGPFVGVGLLWLWATSPAAIGVDTRLLPDNLGLAFALLAVALAWKAAGLDPRHRAAEVQAGARRRAQLMAAIAGALIALAFATRATFAVYGVAVAIVLLLGAGRVRTLACFVLGGCAVHVIELALLAHLAGGPFVRWRILLGYGGRVGQASIFAGYRWADIVLRYPRLLLESCPAELVVHVLGWAGCLWWLWHGRDRRNLARAATLIIAFGGIAWSVVHLSPPVPLLREKLRYYASALPLFQLAAVSVLSALFRRPGVLARLAPAGCIAAIGIAAAREAMTDPSLAIHGNDAYLQAAASIRRDAQSGRRKAVICDFRTSRVMRMLLRDADGWRAYPLEDLLRRWSGEKGGAVASSGYIVLDWKRLNANAWYGYVHAPLTYRAYDVLDHALLVARHQYRDALTDVFYLPEAPFTRPREPATNQPLVWNVGGRPAIEPLRPLDGPATQRWCRFVQDAAGRRWEPLGAIDAAGRLPAGWSVLRRDASGAHTQPIHGPLVIDPKTQLYTGLEPLWRRPRRGPLPAGTVTLTLQARADGPCRLAATLYVWDNADRPARPRRIEMGRERLDASVASVTFSARLENPVAAARIALRATRDVRVEIRTPRVRIFPARPPDRITVRPHEVVYSEVGFPWRRPERATPLDATGLLALSFQARAAQPARLRVRLYGWRAGQRERNERVLGAVRVGPTLETYTVVAPLDVPLEAFRVLFDATNTVALTPPQMSMCRPQSRLCLSGGQRAYSGPGALRRPPRGPELSGGQFVRLRLRAQAQTPVRIRATLWWWPDGARRPVRQLFGRFVARREGYPVAPWTWLPADATAWRVVLENLDSAPVCVDDLSVELLARDPRDRIRQIGGAW